jgi:hypothetical protein
MRVDLPGGEPVFRRSVRAVGGITNDDRIDRLVGCVEDLF